VGRHRFLIALGSNRRHQRHGNPRAILRAALQALDSGKVDVLVASPIIETPPLGPSRRRFANAAALVRTRLAPEDFLHKLQKLERKFGRRSGGRRWGERVLDLDIVLWNGGPFVAEGLVIPHPHYRERMFVLSPAMQVAPDWRDPLTGLTLRHQAARLTRPQPATR